MVFHFPDSDTLRLALTSGAVPPAVSLAPVRAGFDPQGPLWLEPSVNLSRAAQKELTRLGANAVKGAEKQLTDTLTCWLQLLPLQRSAVPPAPSAQTPVLFELASAAALPAIVGEVLRLGNDRQSFRALAGDADQRTLLRIVGPPYYTLLRALDRDGHTAAPLAYLESGPRVYVQVGYTYPLLKLLQPPPGQLVLMRPPRSWLFVEEAPFRDIYEILDFTLPQTAADLHEVPQEQRLRVPLRLAPGGAHDVPELWVLRQRGLEQIDELVRGADDLLLSRLSFAVGDHDGQRTHLLRVRPSKLPPPVLVLPDAVSFRSYLKLPNLFLPCGARLQPPLRRDAVRKLLAEQTDLVTWLYPHPDGSFTAESLPDQVFRPLSDWIDYVLDHDHAALQTWVEATQFDFDSFICKDDQEPMPDKPKKPVRDRHSDRGTPDQQPSAPAAVPFQAPPKKPNELDRPLERKRLEPNQLQKELQALEQQFLACPGPVDTEERLQLWPRLAELNSTLDHGSEAMICWANALWNGAADAPALARRWAAHENHDTGEYLSQKQLERILGQPETSTSLVDVRRLAACVIAAPEHPRAGPLRQRLADVQAFLQRHEKLLPVRVVWLVGLALHQLSGGDVLALTRCRDRLLERLYRNSLGTDIDLPNFLRFSAVRGDRMRVFRDWLVKLPERVEHWLTHVDRSDANPRNTNAYAQLILAFGMARLGDEQESRRLQAQAHSHLETECARLQPPAQAYAQAYPQWSDEERKRNLRPPDPEIHSLLLEAFDVRLRQALLGESAVGPLPAAWLTRVEPLEHMVRYKVDKLREYSRILEPQVKTNPYQRFHLRFITDLAQALTRLQDVADRQQLQDELRYLHTRVGRSTAEEKLSWAGLLTGCLALAPRVGEALADELLDDVFPCCDGLEELSRSRRKSSTVQEFDLFEKHSELLERALFVAAHFNQTQRVQQLVGRFRHLLQAQQGPGMLKALNVVAAQSFRGLRKLGMRDQIDQLLRQMAEVILQGRDMSTLRDEKLWPQMLTVLLRIADGWFYFGKEAEANEVVEEARRLLYTGSLDAHLQFPLAFAYVATLTQAPVEQALQAIEELFTKLTRVKDDFATNTHFAVRQLSLIEAVVLAMVSEDFALGAQSRRWLDDEEYLIRRRIHEDVGQASRTEPG